MEESRRKGELFSWRFDGEVELEMIRHAVKYGQELDFCAHIADMFFYCHSIRHQFRYVYHHGEADTCVPVRKLAVSCAKKKLNATFVANDSGKGADDGQNQAHAHGGESHPNPSGDNTSSVPPNASDDEGIKLPWKLKQRYLDTCGERVRQRYHTEQTDGR